MTWEIVGRADSSLFKHAAAAAVNLSICTRLKDPGLSLRSRSSSMAGPPRCRSGFACGKWKETGKASSYGIC